MSIYNNNKQINEIEKVLRTVDRYSGELYKDIMRGSVEAAMVAGLRAKIVELNKNLSILVHSNDDIIKKVKTTYDNLEELNNDLIGYSFDCELRTLESQIKKRKFALFAGGKARGATNLVVDRAKKGFGSGSNNTLDSLNPLSGFKKKK